MAMMRKKQGTGLCRRTGYFSNREVLVIGGVSDASGRAPESETDNETKAVEYKGPLPIETPCSFYLLRNSGSGRMIDRDVNPSLRKLQLWFVGKNGKPDDILQLLPLQVLVDFLEEFAGKMSGDERFAVGYEFIFVRTILINFEGWMARWVWTRCLMKIDPSSRVSTMDLDTIFFASERKAHLYVLCVPLLTIRIVDRTLIGLDQRSAELQKVPPYFRPFLRVSGSTHGHIFLRRASRCGDRDLIFFELVRVLASSTSSTSPWSCLRSIGTLLFPLGDLNCNSINGWEMAKQTTD
jgi:hypothetical protein